MKSDKFNTRFGEEYGLRQIGMFDTGIIWNGDNDKWSRLRKKFQSGKSDTSGLLHGI